MSKEKIAVHCKTEEEWDNVQKLYPWPDGKPVSWGDRSGGVNGNCLSIEDGKCMGHSHYSYFSEVELGYTIIPASEYLREFNNPGKLHVGEEFKVGDRVISIDHKRRVGEYVLDGQEIYTISKVGMRYYYLEETDDRSYRKERFRLVNKSTNQPKTTKEEEVKMKDQNVTFESNIYQVFKGDPEMMEKINKRFAGQYATADDRTLIALRNDKEKLITIIQLEEKEEASIAAEAKKK
jgi:hypothetical protein